MPRDALRPSAHRPVSGGAAEMTATARRGFTSAPDAKPAYGLPISWGRSPTRRAFPSRALGEIEIADRFSLVEVPEEIADEIIAAMRKAMIRGNKVEVRRDR